MTNPNLRIIGDKRSHAKNIPAIIMLLVYTGMLYKRLISLSEKALSTSHNKYLSSRVYFELSSTEMIDISCGTLLRPTH